MTTIEKEILIHAPIETVFEYVVRPENHVKMNPSIIGVDNVEELANGCYEGDFTLQVLGRTFTGHFRDVEYDPPNRSAYEIEGDLDARITYDLRRENGSTRFTYTNEFKRPGSEVIGGLASAVLKPYLELNAEFMLENTKVILETKEATTDSAPRFNS